MLLSKGSKPDSVGQPARTTDHNVLIDIAKGVGILLVVVGHAWRGLNGSNLIKDAQSFAFVDTLVYNFHMPLFFILSGMTFERWALHHSFSKAALSRVTRLLWPLLLWTYVFSAARLAAGEHANTPLAGVSSLIFFPLPARDHFWFLWAMFLLHMAFLALIRFVGKPLAPIIWMVLAGFLVLTGSLGLFHLNAWTVGAGSNVGAFVVGLSIARYQSKPAGLGVFFLAAVTFIGVQALSFALSEAYYLRQVFGILIAIAALSIVSTLCIGRNGFAIRLLAHLGVCSMGIFLTHTIFSAGVRSALRYLSSDLSLHMILGVAAGVIGPLLIYAVMRKVGKLSWIGF